MFPSPTCLSALCSGFDLATLGNSGSRLQSPAMPVSGLASALSSSIFSPAGLGYMGGESRGLGKVEEESKRGIPGTSIIVLRALALWPPPSIRI